jgi:hypothetical protein
MRRLASRVTRPQARTSRAGSTPAWMGGVLCLLQQHHQGSEPAGLELDGLDQGLAFVVVVFGEVRVGPDNQPNDLDRDVLGLVTLHEGDRLGPAGIV